MGVPTSEVGYISAMPRREDHEVHKDMWGHWIKKKNITLKKYNLFTDTLPQHLVYKNELNRE